MRHQYFCTLDNIDIDVMDNIIIHLFLYLGVLLNLLRIPRHALRK